MQAGLGVTAQYPIHACIGMYFCAVIDRQNIGFSVDDHAQFGASQHNRLDTFLGFRLGGNIVCNRLI